MTEYTLGIDTSNYTTSAALYSSETSEMISKTLLLEVSKGQKGLRQSDAVFLHTKNLPVILERLIRGRKINAVGVSSRPRDVNGSYMPCFLVGEGYGRAIASSLNLSCFSFSHQKGHIAAALFGSSRLDLVNKKLIAFHYSGGTSECVLYDGERDETALLGKTLDISAGQLIDRVGVMLGIPFPCGIEIEKLALNAQNKIPPKACVNRRDINFSGLENIALVLFDKGEEKEEIAAFVINSILKTVILQTEDILKEYNLPLIYSGGVMSCTVIKKYIEKKYGGIFSPPEFSRDNAAGIAVLANLKRGETFGG